MAMPGTAIAGGIDPSKTTFNDLTKEQQDILYKWAFDSFPYMDFANPCNEEEEPWYNMVTRSLIRRHGTTYLWGRA